MLNKNIMVRLSMESFGISKQQLVDYEKYKKRVIEYQNSLKKFEILVYNFFTILTFIFVPLIFLISFEEKISVYIIQEEYFELGILTFMILIFYSFVLFFTGIGFLLSGILIELLRLFGIYRIVIFIYSKFNKEPLKIVYLDKIQAYENHNSEYFTYITLLKQNYPEIEIFNFDVKLYKENIFHNITKEEMEKYNLLIADKNLAKEKNYWSEMNGFKFEHEISSVYKSLGYLVETTKGSGDGGIDIKL